MEKIAVVIVAGGSGSRMGGGVPKQFLPLAGRPVLVHTVERFVKVLPGATLIVVLPDGEQQRWAEICREYGLTGTHRVATGGKNRFESVRNGLVQALDADYVLVQDGVRPLAGEALIGRVMETVRRSGTALPVVEPVDSFRILTREEGGACPEFPVWPDEGPANVPGESDRESSPQPQSAAAGDAGGTGVDFCACSLPIDRSRLRAVQTPQGFAGEILRQAYRQPWSPQFTDDASVVESSGVRITLCEGSRSNIKITTPGDLVLAEALLLAGN